MPHIQPGSIRPSQLLAAQPFATLPLGRLATDHSRIPLIDPEQARIRNAAIAFARRPNPAANPFRFEGSTADFARAVDCLAAAQIFEAGDDAVGEKAVAQVVLNRVRHPAFPKSICGVVFQGQDRRTGCQFTFTCDGSLARTPSHSAWERSRAIATAALQGAVFRPVGLATHYHTDWVAPYWSGSMEKAAQVGTHLFFRWAGRWGAATTFGTAAPGGEPVIGRIAHLSSVHQPGSPLLMTANSGPASRSIAMGTRAVPESMRLADKSWSPAPVTPLPGGMR